MLFAQSTRKHKVAKGRARWVLEHPLAIVPIPPKEDGRDEVLMFLGDDHMGRALEVGAVRLKGSDLLVIHVMDLRDKFRHYYEQGKKAIRDGDET